MKGPHWDLTVVKDHGNNLQDTKLRISNLTIIVTEKYRFEFEFRKMEFLGNGKKKVEKLHFRANSRKLC